jgi:flagellar hook protein FlgE
MSINSAMLAGVSGLVANSSAMGVISDNIANVNTTAYKRSRADFTRMVNAQSASTTYNSGGVTAKSRALVTAQGNISNTSTVSDLAIQGQGFFAVTTKSTAGSAAADGVAFTRVGSFAPDEQGYLKNQAGFYLQGWRIDSAGAYPNSPTDLSKLETVNLNAISGTASPSTTAAINGNLKATTAVSAAAAAVPTAGAGAYSAATNNMASGTVRPDASWSFQIYDSLGGLRTFNVLALKSATANQWHVEIVASPASSVTAGAPLVNGQVKTGTLAFTPTGKLDLAATSPALLSSLDIGASTAGAPAAGGVNWAASTGLDAQAIDLQIGQSTKAPGITQYDSVTAISSTTSDGSLFGSLSGIEIDKDGFVSGIFNNGVSKKLYKLPIATFVNPDGLQSESGGIYKVTNASGTYNMKEPGTAGAGAISSSSLETSTVDLALEFTNMITTQRAYSASSKIITTADEMLDELIRIKR